MPLPRNESFASALDAAIEDAGLSLDRVRQHLADRGVTLSRSALSYWRHGRSRPERSTSLQAVVQLEEVLELSPGALTSLLGPNAPRGRWLNRPVRSMTRRRLWPSLRPMSAELKPPPDRQLSFWSVHDQMLVDELSRERALRVRIVAEAIVDGVSRMMTYYQTDDLDRQPPRYGGARFCRVGRVRTDPATGLLVGELLLDRTLTAGEVTAIEYELTFPLGEPTDFYHRRLTRLVPLYVCQVQFGLRTPERVYRYEQRDLSGPHRKVGELPIGATHAVTLAARDVRPGIIGMRWD